LHGVNGLCPCYEREGGVGGRGEREECGEESGCCEESLVEGFDACGTSVGGRVRGRMAGPIAEGDVVKVDIVALDV